MCRLDLIGMPDSRKTYIWNGIMLDYFSCQQATMACFSRQISRHASSIPWSSLFRLLCAGDFVDRGAWGMELLALLLALKLTFPNYVYLLRGNHESSTCTRFYGFKGEVDAKYSPTEAEATTPHAPPAGAATEATGVPSGEGPAMLAASCSTLPPMGVVPPMQRPHADAKAGCYRMLQTLRCDASGAVPILHPGLILHPSWAVIGK